LQVQSIRPVGEGSIKKSADLLRARLDKEGLFSPEHKRALPFPPERIALIASKESAGYADFMKIIQMRWPFITVSEHHVQVQGSLAIDDVVDAIRQVNEQATLPDVLVIIRGGGSADDLAAFSTEPVVRAVAASRTPTLVAIGHEVDVALAELAADVRASTPSNAAELLVPEHGAVTRELVKEKSFLQQSLNEILQRTENELDSIRKMLELNAQHTLKQQIELCVRSQLRLESYHPKQVLRRGYALVRSNGVLVRSEQRFVEGQEIEIELEKSVVGAHVITTKEKV
jgi:exodeoxyribonuclease VII large subunit